MAGTRRDPSIEVHEAFVVGVIVGFMVGVIVTVCVWAFTG